MISTRRTFLTRTAATVTGAAILSRGLRASASSMLDAQVHFGACIFGLEEGQKAGLEGVEIGVGGPADRLQIADPKFRARVKDQMRRTGLVVPSLMMGLLNDCALARDPRGPAWLEQSIDGAKDLGAKVILVAFFGNGDLLSPDGKLKEDDVSVVVERLKAAAPRAKDAGVFLAIENYLDAEQNARILDRVNHDSVRIYYDCYNTGGTKKYDVPAEIRRLRDRIVQFHFKNGDAYLETGEVHYEPVVQAIKDIGYKGWVVLETSSPSHNAVADAKKNADYARGLFASKG